MNSYKALNKQTYQSGEFSIVPIRHQDRYDIMRWRNEQIYHLRQSKPLTEADQDRYFNEVVSQLFDQQQPEQILFSFLEGERCIGYGGLVHIDWNSKNSEISFLLETSKNTVSEYLNYSSVFFQLIQEVGSTAGLVKIYTYGYDIDDYRFKSLYTNGYELEAYLHEHKKVYDKFVGVRIYSKQLQRK